MSHIYKACFYFHLSEKLIKLIIDTLMMTVYDEKLILIIVGLIVWTIC